MPMGADGPAGRGLRGYRPNRLEPRPTTIEPVRMADENGRVRMSMWKLVDAHVGEYSAAMATEAFVQKGMVKDYAVGIVVAEVRDAFFLLAREFKGVTQDALRTPRRSKRWFCCTAHFRRPVPSYRRPANVGVLAFIVFSRTRWRRNQFGRGWPIL